MITPEGASLLAQIVPVGLLVLAFDARGAETLVGAVPTARLALLVSRVFIALTVPVAVILESACVIAALDNRAIEGFGAGAAYVAAYALWLAVAVTLSIAVFTRTGLADLIHDRNMRDPIKRERFLSAVIESSAKKRSEEAAERLELEKILRERGLLVEPAGPLPTATEPSDPPRVPVSDTGLKDSQDATTRPAQRERKRKRKRKKRRS